MGKTGVDVPALLARVSVQPLVEIATNPLMLTAIAVIYWNGKKLPERRAELYETILLWLAESRDHKRKGRLDAAHSLRVLGTLALALQRTRRGQNVEIGLGDAVRLILGDFKDGPEAAEKFLEQELTDSGIIIGRGRNLKFWHRTFQEYLAGWKLSYDFDPSGPFLAVKPHLHAPEWREVVLLLSGALWTKGSDARLNEFLQSVMADGLEKDTLPERAQCAGLVGAMLADLRGVNFAMGAGPEPLWKELQTDVRRLFRKEEAAQLDLKKRVAAAEALGWDGHPISTISDAEYWAPFAGGTFQMGEGKGKKTTVKAFRLAKYPVTVHEYSEFLAARPELEKPFGWEKQLGWQTRPVTGVTWFDAEAFCSWRGGRLPKKEEWEFAARGAEGRKYPWGAEEPDTWRVNFGDPSSASTPVGIFPAGESPEGVADMAGNVLEWTGIDYLTTAKVVRGGSYWDVATYLRGAFGTADRPGFGSSNIGFRCLREVLP